jgi:hypothetical protein
MDENFQETVFPALTPDPSALPEELTEYVEKADL